jgi:hypothetical protein
MRSSPGRRGHRGGDARQGEEDRVPPIARGDSEVVMVGLGSAFRAAGGLWWPATAVAGSGEAESATVRLRDSNAVVRFGRRL